MNASIRTRKDKGNIIQIGIFDANSVCVACADSLEELQASHGATLVSLGFQPLPISELTEDML